MNITRLSRDRVMQSASHWTVAREYFDPLYNYLVHGYEPGSFWTAVLSNDFMRAIQHSHPANSISHLKHVVGWIQDSWPEAAYGDLFTVQTWTGFSGQERRLYLESAHLIYTEQEEIMKGLRGETSPEPQLD